MQNMIDLADQECDSRIVNYLLKNPVQDGGQYVINNFKTSLLFLTTGYVFECD